jgi:uncharacterized protein
MPELDLGLLVAAWLTGLVGGSGHCLGMCGGIVGALGMRSRSGARGVATSITVQLGRVAGYASGGALVGLVGSTLAAGLLGSQAAIVMRAIAAVVIVLVGLQLASGIRFLRPIERFGGLVWMRLAPLLGGLLPPRDPGRGFVAGMLWSLLPCGLVYAQLSIAATSGSALAGAATMACFGVGTIVGLGALGTLLHLAGLSRLPRRAGGALIVLFGVWMLLPAVLAMPHGSAHDAHATATVRR